jgi:hypothetical protein
MFAITEELVVSRRVWLRLSAPPQWRWLASIVRPGGGRGAAYVLVQMVVLLWVAWLLGAGSTDWVQLRWLLAICAYICFFCAVPVFVARALWPTTRAAVKLRVAILVLLAISMIVPDVLYYMIWQPEVLDLEYSARHLINPLRTLANWHVVERHQWFSFPATLGLAGLVASLGLIVLGRRATGEHPAIDLPASAPSSGAPGRADLY